LESNSVISDAEISHLTALETLNLSQWKDYPGWTGGLIESINGELG
jgi:hypothetical protein